MKGLSLLVWLTQLGMSVALPIAGYVLLAVWLKNRLSLGWWILVLGIGLGLVSAIRGLKESLKVMERLSREKKDDTPPPVSFSDHN